MNIGKTVIDQGEAGSVREMAVAVQNHPLASQLLDAGSPELSWRVAPAGGNLRTNRKRGGVMGDGRTYEYVVALRAVQTQDFMTAHWAHLPHELLGKVSNRIINEVRGINRVVFDISGKPPSTIEWE